MLSILSEGNLALKLYVYMVVCKQFLAFRLVERGTSSLVHQLSQQVSLQEYPKHVRPSLFYFDFRFLVCWPQQCCSWCGVADGERVP